MFGACLEWFHSYTQCITSDITNDIHKWFKTGSRAPRCPSRLRVHFDLGSGQDLRIVRLSPRSGSMVSVETAWSSSSPSSSAPTCPLHPLSRLLSLKKQKQKQKRKKEKTELLQRSLWFKMSKNCSAENK